ncbi:hypothetical protein Trydic_g21756 [Trypoxylus dichotomus]
MGPKKKLTRAERNRMEMERLEQARIQAELEAQRAIEEEMRRLEMERRLAMEKEKRETAEQALRVEQLTSSNLLIKNIVDYSWKIDRKEKRDFQWKQYLKCDGLPDATNPPQMSTYLHLWKKMCEDVTVEEVKRRTGEIISLLEVLGDFIQDPFDASEALIENWRWIRTQCREQQHENLDMATYRLLRDINARMNRPDIPTADFTITDEHFILCLWLTVNLATPMHNPRAPAKKRMEINFPETRLNILFPTTLKAKDIVIRAIYLKYDHLSDDCETYDKPEMVKDIDQDLLESTCREWYVKMKYKWDNHRRQSGIVERGGGYAREDEDTAEIELSKFEDDEIPPVVPYKKLDPTASQYAINLEGTLSGSDVCISVAWIKKRF